MEQSTVSSNWEVKPYEDQLTFGEKMSKGIRNPRQALTYLAKKIRSVKATVLNKGYYDVYLEISDGGAASVDPDHELPDEQSRWEFRFLKEKGIRSDDRLLDLGCGFGRLGYHMIEYLEHGNYYGIDISDDSIERFERNLDRYDLRDADPTVFQNENLQFDDPEFQDVQFDYIFAYSVFTHLPPENIETCLRNLKKVLTPKGNFYATFHRNDDVDYIVKRPRGIGFEYPVTYFDGLAERYGLRIDTVSSRGPRNQDMLEIGLE